MFFIWKLDTFTNINYEFWKDDLCKVLDFIQWYGIDETQLKKSLATTDGIIKCLEPKAGVSLETPPSILPTLLSQTLTAVNAAKELSFVLGIQVDEGPPFKEAGLQGKGTVHAGFLGNREQALEFPVGRSLSRRARQAAMPMPSSAPRVVFFATIQPSSTS